VLFFFFSSFTFGHVGEGRRGKIDHHHTGRSEGKQEEEGRKKRKGRRKKKVSVPIYWQREQNKSKLYEALDDLLPSGL